MLPSEEVTSEQIEDVLGHAHRDGHQRRRDRGGRGGRRPERAEAAAGGRRRGGEGGELAEAAPPRGRRGRETAKEPTDRTDDPVRMYLREMGSVELLSREGEIAIAKRIEAGREAMIAGLCESPLTFQAIIIWRDELNEGQRAPARHHRPRGDLCRPRRQGRAESRGGADGTAPACRAAAPPVAAARRRRAVTLGVERGGGGAAAPPEGDLEDDDMENNVSLSAMEAELKPQVLETFDRIADNYKKLRRLQDEHVEPRMQNKQLTPGPGAQVQEAQGRDRRAT